MARILPDGWEQLEIGAIPFEITTLRLLGSALPGDYTVFHGVHWTRVEHGFSVFGEIDFVVVGPDGQCVAIEQKNGPLVETQAGLVKHYKGKDKHVSGQIQRSMDGLLRRFRYAHGGRSLPLDYLLYCPDYRVQSPATAGIAPERIVDARNAAGLAEVIVALIQAQPAVAGITVDVAHAFLSDTLELVADANALVGQARTWVTRLSGGLATWAPQLHFAPFRLRVVGTAGSGKTQLALRVLEDAAAKGLQALYVCFNRPLADHIARIVPRSASVATFHLLCDRHLRALGRVPDFADPAAFQAMAQAYIDAAVGESERVDVLVVDEGQDFQQAWANALLARLKLEGSAWWLEDPMQNLYGRPRIELPSWVELHADVNYRTPRDILDEIGMLVDMDAPIKAASPVRGEGIETATYSDFTSLKEATVAAVRRAKAAGFKPEDIVILTFCGRERSQLFPFDMLGGLTLRRFDGNYDGGGNPTFQDGEILLETVFRFKGQSAPYVVLTEIDGDAWDEGAMRRLYVGATRARIALSLVISETLAAKLMERLR